MGKKLSRRQLVKGVGAVMAGTLLEACVPTTPQTVLQTAVVTPKETAVANAAEKVVTAAPATGPKNALGVSLPADALPLDQQFRTELVGEIGGAYGHLMESLYNRAFEHNGGAEALTTLDINMNVVGEGAESWQISDDGSYWDFKLNKNLTFSDGKPVTANDWVYTLRRSLSNGYDFGWFYFDIKNASKVYDKSLPPEQLGMEAVDDYTLRIHTEAPVPYFPAIGVWFVVAPKQAYDQYGENWALDPKKYISSGPYILTEFERGVGHKWGLNTKYTGVRKVYWNEIREVKRPKTLPTYMAKQLDWYDIDGNTPAGEVALIKANPILSGESHPQPPSSTDYLGFNTLAGKFPPLDNPDVRLALCKAIDKEALVAQIFQGFAHPAWGVLPKGFPNYIGDQLKELDINKYEPDKAKALLAKAGYADGKGFPAFEMYIRQPNDKQKAICEAVQARWKEVLGIQVELRPSDFQSFTDAAFKNRTAPIYFVSYALDYYDPATFLNVFRDGGRHPTEAKAWTEAYNKANATLDTKQRLELMAQSEKDLVASSAYYFLNSPFTVRLWPCNLAGPAVQVNKDGFQFNGGGGVGCTHAFEEMYWNNSDCRAGLA